MLRIPHRLNNRLIDGGEVGLRYRPHFTPRKIPGTHVCYRLSETQSTVQLEGLGKFKNQMI
jgi:hypothetical protein